MLCIIYDPAFQGEYRTGVNFTAGTLALKEGLGISSIAATVVELLSKALKQKGFVFTGPVSVYAYMQAAGIVNDHLVSCFRYKEVQGI